MTAHDHLSRMMNEMRREGMLEGIQHTHRHAVESVKGWHAIGAIDRDKRHQMLAQLNDLKTRLTATLRRAASASMCITT